MLCNQEILRIESPEPFFALVAKYNINNRNHNDLLQLVKQYLALIQIHLIIEPISLSGDSIDLVDYIDFDLLLMNTNSSSSSVFGFDPFGYNSYNENGSWNFSGYDTRMDWDENLGTGRNEWYIQTGKNILDNTSQEALEHSWAWQFYLMDEILPCLPLFKTEYNNITTYQYLVFNLRETRSMISRRNPCPGYPTKSQGLAVRKAISYAINREEIRKVVYGNNREIYDYPINPSNKTWLNLDIFKYCHSLKVGMNFMYVIGIILGWNTDWGGYEPWPEWEDVCLSQPNTISVIGYDIMLTTGILSITSVTWLLLQSRKKRRKSE